MLLRPCMAKLVQLFCIVTPVLASTVFGDPLHGSDWPQFRGKGAAGTVTLTTDQAAVLPTEWNVSSSENVRWQIPIPGLGLGSAIICGEKVFLVTAVGEKDPKIKTGLYGNIMPVQDESEHEWLLYCLAKSTGEVAWKRKLHEGVPAIKRHTKASHANTTPASDGRYVVVLLGSEGLHCYDVHGNTVWKKDFGVLDSGFYMLPGAQWGFGSSPIIFEDLVLIQCDVQEDSFVAAFDLKTGDERWRTDRDDVPSWGTPTVHVGKRSQMIVNGYRHSGGYDVRSGKELWRIAGGGDIPVPTPVVAKEMIVLSSAHGKENPLRAVHVDAEGEIEPDNDGAHAHLAWNKPREGVYMPTPLVYRDLLYTCRISGVVTCYDLVSGDRVYRERLGGNAFTASPVAADDKLYFASEDGDVYVVRAGKEFELLATNSMDDVCMATPSIADGILFVRTKDFLYAIAKPAAAPVELAQTSNGWGADEVVHDGVEVNEWQGSGSVVEEHDCGCSPALSIATPPAFPTNNVALAKSSETVASAPVADFPDPGLSQQCEGDSCSCCGQRVNCACGRRRPIRDCVRRLFCR